MTPTVGRVVWFYPGVLRGALVVHGDQPLAAKIVYVWNDRLVNLVVHDHVGNMHAYSSVQLVQEGDEKPVGVNHAEWPPVPAKPVPALTPTEAKPATEPLPPPPPAPTVTVLPPGPPPKKPAAHRHRK